MKSEHWLSVSLLLALCSNASLLLILTYRAVNYDNSTANTCREQHQHQQQQQQKHPRACQPSASPHTRIDIHGKQTTEQGTQPHTPELFHLNKLDDVDKTLDSFSRDDKRRQSPSRLVTRKDDFSKQNRLERAHSKDSTDGDFTVENIDGPENFDTAIDNILSGQIGVFLRMYDRLSKIDPNVYFSSNFPKKSSRHAKPTHVGHVNNELDKIATFEITESANGQSFDKLNLKDLTFKSQESVIRKEGDTGARSRTKRDADAGQAALSTGNYLNYDFQFSKWMKKDIGKFSSPVGELLIPSLIHFEEWVIRLVEEIHFAMLSHDLRLERVEKALLNLANSRDSDTRPGKRRGDQWQESPQSDALDNLTNDAEDILQFPDDVKGYPGNISLELEVLEGDSSGDSDINSTFIADGISTISSNNNNNVSTSAAENTTTTTTTTTSTSTSTTSTTTTTTQAPTKPIAYYDLLREMQEMKQKVLALENYNTMSDSELTRVRSEVTRMDDKVIEMQRRQKNTNAIASMHTFKITELEMAMKRTDVALNLALDSYGRLSSRVASFKDRLTDFSREVHAVTVHFSRHEQISNELRSADSYKAHDILELRKSMLGMETRVNELYSILDMNMDTVRTDIRSWLDRLCFNNKLAC